VTRGISACSRSLPGSTTAPLLNGAVWDFGGAGPAYLVATAWSGVLTIAP